jgi:hypothetical protein
MAILNTFTKQPAESLDYDIEYEDFLSTGDSVASGTAVATPSGLTVDAPLVVGTALKLWVSGGTAGTTYKVEVTMTTALGRIKQDELRFRIKDY